MKICSVLQFGLSELPVFINGSYWDIYKNGINQYINESLTKQFWKENLPISEITTFLRTNGYEPVYSEFDKQNTNILLSESGASNDLLVKFYNLLMEKIVTFKYRKCSTQEIRMAHGTLRRDVIPQKPNYLKNHISRFPKKLFVYWDLDCQDFRCFRLENFLTYYPKTAREPTNKELISASGAQEKIVRKRTKWSGKDLVMKLLSLKDSDLDNFLDTLDGQLHDTKTKTAEQILKDLKKVAHTNYIKSNIQGTSKENKNIISQAFDQYIDSHAEDDILKENIESCQKLLNSLFN